ncbi:MAG: SdrD B-like domain-containing protein [Actinomycetota bacterium]
MATFSWRTRAARFGIGLVALGVASLTLTACHRPTLIDGVVWFDTDFDGIRDAGERTAAGIVVRADCTYDGGPGRQFDDGPCGHTTTDDDGRYRLFVTPIAQRGSTEVSLSFAAPPGLEAVQPPGVRWEFRYTHREQRDETGVDAALIDTAVGNIGDRVWHDDGDGIQEDGEPGMAGIPVDLLAGRAVVASTETGGDGSYLFEGVPEGRYIVRFGPLPAGLRFSRDRRGVEGSAPNPYSGLATVDLEGGGADLNVDAGVVTAEPGELGEIGDFVWADLDSDGVQDDGEPGVAGAEVLLVGASTGQLSFTLTEADGRYRFLVSRALAPTQRYRLVFVEPDGRGFSPPDAAGDAVDSDADPGTGRTPDFDLGPDEVDLSWDAGLVSTEPGDSAAIGDRVWEDVDGDGIQDPGEPGLPNVPVSLIGDDDQVVATTATDDGGLYGFTGLAAGDYRVHFDAPGGFGFTAPDQGGDGTLDSDALPATGNTGVFTLQAGVADSSLDAGLVRPTTGGSATVGDLVWHDVNQNGLQDPDEPGIANVTVALLDAAGNVLATTTTNAIGFYGFSGLAPGDYRLRFDRPPGLSVTIGNAGTDDTIDSDINGARETDLFTLVEGQTDNSIDAGFRLLG